MKDSVPKHVEILSSFLLIASIALMSPLAIMWKEDILIHRQELFAWIMFFMGFVVLFLNLAHAIWYINKGK